jgi:hypothetical protein
MSQENPGPWWIMAGRPGHPAGRGGSGQILADRVLDAKWFGLPLRRFAAAQPRLSCCPPPPPCRRANTTRDQASTTWPSGRRSRVDRAVSNAWSSSCSNRPRPASGSAARISSPALAGAGRSLFGHAHHLPSSPSRPVFPRKYAEPWPPGARMVGRLVDVLHSASDDRSAPRAGIHGTLPTTGPMLHPRSIAVLRTIPGREWGERRSSIGGGEAWKRSTAGTRRAGAAKTSD